MSGLGIDAQPRRSAFQRLADLRERERITAKLAEDLPEGVCSACGGIVRAGTGTLAAASAWAPNALDFGVWKTADRERVSAGRPALLGWRRRHDGCRTTSQIVAQLIDVDVPLAVAADGLFALRQPILAADKWRAPRAADMAIGKRPKPWAHVTETDVADLRRAIDRARAKVEPRRCKSGGCAWCGVRESIGWRTGPETWADGSSAPLCRACAAVWDRRGNPTEEGARRATAAEAATGVWSWGDDGLRTFSDLAGETHDGTPEPWTYAPDAIARLRAERAKTPAERNAERAAIYAAAAAEEVEARAAREAEALRAGGWIDA